MRRRLYLYCICILTLLFMVVGCQKKDDKEEKIIRPVKFMRVAPAQSLTMRSFPGKVLAGEEVRLAFEVSGRLIVFPVKEGEAVTKDQLIARIDSKIYKEKVQEMHARYLETRAQYLRAHKLVKQDFISRAKYDATRANYAVAEANYNTAKHDLKDTSLKAPFSGVIAKTYVENHEYIKVQQPIAELHDTKIIDIEIDVPENIMINLMRENKQYRMEHKPMAVFDAKPKRKFPLSFKEVATTADPNTQTFRVVFSMPHPKNINVLPGMSVNVHAAIPDFNAAAQSFYLLPSSAVFMGPDQKPSVWVINLKTMRIKRTLVTVAQMADKNIKVLTGLQEGQHVVTAGVHYLQENEEVKLLKPVRK